MTHSSDIPMTDVQPGGIAQGKSRAFVFGALFLFAALLLAVLVKQNYFSQTTTLYFFTPNALGMNVGMAVKFVGFKVGQIERISMEPTAQVKVALSLNNEYIHLINRDAKARLIKEGLIGESVVEIVPSGTNTRQVAQNDVLAFERGGDIAELAEKLVGQVQPILTDVKKITAAVSDADQDIRESLRNANQVSAELVKTTRQLNLLVGNGNRTLTDVHHSVTVVDDALPQMVSNLQESLNNVQATTAEIRKMATPPSGQIPHLLNNGNMLLRDSSDIVGAAKQTWPISAMLPEPEQRMLPLDGDVGPLRQMK